MTPQLGLTPTAQAQKPDTQPPSHSRPLPHRYLQDTASKLGQDSLRFYDGRTSQQSTATTAPSPGPGQLPQPWSPSPGTALESSAFAQMRSAEGDANMWRRLFHAEALECVQAMQAVVDKANVSTCASRLDDWRKFDLRATAQLQQHVKEVMHLNQTLEVFLQDCAAPEEMTKFKGAIVMLTEASDELTLTRREICTGVDTVAERASAKVVEAWESDVKLSSQVLGDHTREQNGRWIIDDARWERLEARVGELQDHVGHLRSTVEQQTDEVSKATATQCQESSRISSEVQDGVKEMQALVSKSFAEISETLKEHATRQLDEFKAHNFELLLGEGITESRNKDSRRHSADGVPPKQHNSLGHVLRDIDGRLSDWDCNTRAKRDEWRADAEKLRLQLDEQELQAKELSSCHEESVGKTAELDVIVNELREELGQTRQNLTRAQTVSMKNSMKRLKELESRGNIKINRQTGAVTLPRAMEFLQCMPNEEPTGRFANETAAMETLQDVACLAGIFEVAWMELEIRVKTVKGGSQDFFGRLATAQADLVREQFEAFRDDFPMQRITVKGTAGNQDAECVVRLDSSIFADQPKGKAKAKAR